MLFNSIQFFTFFIIVLFIYYIIPKKAQWLYLLIISFIYYIYWDPKSVFFLFLSICSSYTSAILISQNCSKPGFRKLLVAITIVLNIGLLFFFKYSQMLLDTFLQTENITLNLIAPIGISFYTFRVVGYVIDVYRGNITAEKNWGKFALYASFFPQIISGPIERSYHFLPQLDEEHHFDYNKVKEGFLQFICGLLKKIVIADRLNILVSQVFNDVYSYGTSAYIIAILFYTMQIYFDFSGYSDMAIGCGKMMGFYTMQNFNRPYFSNTISDFWRRWHISLSSWFKDYLYIPLGGNRVSTTRWALNMMIVFLVSGMWHGSNWTFIIWGGLHGIYQIIGKLTRQKRLAFYNKFHITIGKLRITPPQLLSGVITFFLIAYAWMFFRANTVADAMHITKSLILWENNELHLLDLGMEKYDLIFSIVIIIVYFLIELIQSKISLNQKLQALPLPIRWSIYMILIFICILFGIYGDLSESSFIYFQF